MSGHGSGWANPAPAGLIALAVACFIFFALLAGKVKASCLPLMGVWLLGGFVVQLVVGIIELAEGALTGGNVFLYFAAFFMLVGGLEMQLKFFGGKFGWGLDATIDGWAWLALFISLVFIQFCYYKQSTTVMGILLLSLVIAVFFVAMMDGGWLGAQYKPIAAYGLLISGICGLYQACAILVNAAFGKVVMPTGGPVLK